MKKTINLVSYCKGSNKNGRRRIISANECKKDLEKKLSFMSLSIEEGFQKAREVANNVTQNSRCRGYDSSVLNSCINESLEKNIPESQYKGRYGRILFRINGYIILVKKLNKKGYPMNIKTKHSNSINSQSQTSLFYDSSFGLEEPLVYLGYQLNKFNQLSEIKLVYILDNKINWVVDLKENNVSSTIQKSLFNDKKEVEVLVKSKKDITKEVI